MLFLHVPKCGGSSLNSYWRTQGALWLGYGGAPFRCFTVLYKDAFTPRARRQLLPSSANQSADLLRRCNRTLRAAARYSTRPLVVEFHDRDGEEYFFRLEPYMDALRSHLTVRGGQLVTATVLREPVSLILSWYRMWPPLLRFINGSGGTNTRRAVLPLSAFLAGGGRIPHGRDVRPSATYKPPAYGAQVLALSHNTSPGAHPLPRPIWRDGQCMSSDARLALALARLARFDIACTLDFLNTFAQRTARAIGLRPSPLGATIRPPADIRYSDVPHRSFVEGETQREVVTCDLCRPSHLPTFMPTSMLGGIAILLPWPCIFAIQSPSCPSCPTKVYLIPVSQRQASSVYALAILTLAILTPPEPCNPCTCTLTVLTLAILPPHHYLSPPFSFATPTGTAVVQQ